MNTTTHFGFSRARRPNSGRRLYRQRYFVLDLPPPIADHQIIRSWLDDTPCEAVGPPDPPQV